MNVSWFRRRESPYVKQTVRFVDKIQSIMTSCGTASAYIVSN